jgi:hypothetical protein
MCVRRYPHPAAVPGRSAFQGMHYAEVIERVALHGARPPVPAWLPAPVASLMRACWHADPARRPGFSGIARVLEGLISDLEPAGSRSHLALDLSGALPVALEAPGPPGRRAAAAGEGPAAAAGPAGARRTGPEAGLQVRLVPALCTPPVAAWPAQRVDAQGAGGGPAAAAAPPPENAPACLPPVIALARADEEATTADLVVVTNDDSNPRAASAGGGLVWSAKAPAGGAGGGPFRALRGASGAAALTETGTAATSVVGRRPGAWRDSSAFIEDL